MVDHGENGSSPNGFSGPGRLLPHKLQILEDLLSRPRPQPTDIKTQDAPLAMSLSLATPSLKTSSCGKALYGTTI